MQINIPISLKLHPNERERLKALSNVRHRKPHYLMREAICQYLEREEARETFKQEAITSWESYQQNGLHLTGQEVGDWLDTWGTEQETVIPPCHK